MSLPAATVPRTALVPYFQVHQPFRLRRYTFFDVGVDGRWFDDAENERIVRRVAERCYRPANATLLRAIEESGGRFRCSFSVSGTALDQLERWAPDALDGFVRLAATGCVEILGETSHHSLASLADEAEARAQIVAHADRVERTFGRRPTAFRNTELVVDEAIARVVEDLGFQCLLAEGADGLLGWRSPARVYGVEGCDRLRLLLRHYRLSDDVAFRFSNRSWPSWPLTAEKFAASVHALPEDDAVVGLFMDYETFGEHQWKDTGIFDFLAAMPRAVLSREGFGFLLPTEAARAHRPVARLSIPHPVSWADEARDLSAWLGNPMQRAAHHALYSLLPVVRSCGRADLLDAWRRLSTSDHLYYMCTKRASDGDVHEHFSPYATPHDAFIAYMNVLDDLERRAAPPVADAVVGGSGAMADGRARGDAMPAGSPYPDAVAPLAPPADATRPAAPRPAAPKPAAPKPPAPRAVRRSKRPRRAPRGET